MAKLLKITSIILGVVLFPVSVLAKDSFCPNMEHTTEIPSNWSVVSWMPHHTPEETNEFFGATFLTHVMGQDSKVICSYITKKNGSRTGTFSLMSYDTYPQPNLQNSAWHFTSFNVLQCNGPDVENCPLQAV